MDAPTDPTKKINIPNIKNFFNPYLPANLPNGTENIAIESKKDVANQFWRIAFMENWLAIAGRATAIADVENAVIKDVNAAKKIIKFLKNLSSKYHLHFHLNQKN